MENRARLNPALSPRTPVLNPQCGRPSLHTKKRAPRDGAREAVPLARTA